MESLPHLNECALSSALSPRSAGVSLSGIGCCQRKRGRLLGPPSRETGILRAVVSIRVAPAARATGRASFI